MTINLRKITQGERGTLTFTWEFPENLTSPASISGAVITATMTDEDGVTTAVSGTLTGTAATTCTWALSAGDSGTAGTFTVLFQAIVTGVTTYTLEATLEVIANPSVTGTQNDPLVSISVADAAWLTAAAARVTDGDDVATRDVDGTAGNLTVLDASGNAVDAGYAASQDGIANSVVQRIADGTIYNLISAPASAALIGSNYQGIGIIADSNSDTGLVAKSTSGTYAIKTQDGATQVSGIRRVDGVLEFVGAAAATNRAAQRTELGLGTAALLTAGATGEDLVEASSVDAARAVIGLSAVTMPPRVLNHHTVTWAAANVVGSFSASNYLNFTTLITTGATANSSGSWRINDNSLSLNYTNGSVNWSRKVNISLFLRRGTANAQGIAYWTVGKIPSAAYGLVASGDYIGIKIENQTVTGLVYCVSGTVTTIPVSKSIASTGTPIYITSNNGNIEWYADGVAIGSTASGPTANTFGTIFAEIQNGATAANYTMSIISSSEGF